MITLDYVLRKGTQSNWSGMQAMICVLCDAFCSHTALPRLRHRPDAHNQTRSRSRAYLRKKRAYPFTYLDPNREKASLRRRLQEKEGLLQDLGQCSRRCARGHRSAPAGSAPARVAQTRLQDHGGGARRPRRRGDRTDHSHVAAGISLVANLGYIAELMLTPSAAVQKYWGKAGATRIPTCRLQ